MTQFLVNTGYADGKIGYQCHSESNSLAKQMEVNPQEHSPKMQNR